ncbi:(Fe-S)-binding protein [Desulfomarina sp.]
MLLKGYSLEIFKSKCNSEAKGVHCFAHLDNNISEVLPFLNTVLGGHVYTKEPPSLMVKNYGKLITFYEKKIAVNALADKEEAEKIVAGLLGIINDTWEKRGEIKPSTESVQQPVLIEVLKLLPKTNCRECGEPTCMVFATRIIEGSMDQNDCPSLGPENKLQLKNYLDLFSFG